MKHYYLLSILLVLLTGCSQRPVYEFHVGKSVHKLPVHENAKSIQDDMILELHNLWKDLKQKESVSFYYKCSSPMNIKELKGGFEKKNKVEVDVVSTITCTSAKYRFFKESSGKCGLVVINEKNGKSLTMFSGKHLKWESLEGYLRRQIFRCEDISIHMLLNNI